MGLAVDPNGATAVSDLLRGSVTGKERLAHLLDRIVDQPSDVDLTKAAVIHEIVTAFEEAAHEAMRSDERKGHRDAQQTRSEVVAEAAKTREHMTIEHLAVVEELKHRVDHAVDELATRLKRVEDLLEKLSSSAREAWTDEQLSELERLLDIRALWIVGRDFSNEITSDAPFLDVVKYNLHQRDIHYVYVAPDSPQPRYQLARLRSELDMDENDERLRVILAGEEEWFRLPYTAGNFTIFDPAGRRPSGYFWLPGDDGKSFGQLPRSTVLKWVGQIEEIFPALSP
jgi:ribosome-binding protein aMBF1 (putative translation factor)